MKIVVELPNDPAMALAQLVKRLGYDDAERLSSPIRRWRRTRRHACRRR